MQNAASAKTKEHIFGHSKQDQVMKQKPNSSSAQNVNSLGETTPDFLI